MKSFIVFIAVSGSALAADPEPPTDAITVSATKNATPLAEVAATATVMTGEDFALAKLLVDHGCIEEGLVQVRTGLRCAPGERRPSKR